MSFQDLGSIGEIVAAIATVITLLYLSTQIRQNIAITKAQFGHGLTQRLYDRYFQSSKDAEFASFLGKDWSSDDLNSTEKWRILAFQVMLLVDLFDVYDKVRDGLVDNHHLNVRLHMLKTGIFKTEQGKRSWAFWKILRDQEFVDWFEHEIYGDLGEARKKFFEAADEREDLNVFRQ
tara:strand:+ start:149 stop:679 length:531 start_codon:yes stop_codon:yes gene_type:complete